MLAVMSDLTNRRVDLSVLKDRLRERREVLRLDQEALAERAGMSPAYISRLERGAIPNPKVFDLERVATALGTSVGELMHAGGVSGDDTLHQEVSNLMGPGKAEMVEEIVRKSADLSAAEVRLLLNVVRTHAKELEDRSG